MNFNATQEQFNRRKRNFRIKTYFIFSTIFLLAIGIFSILIYSPIFKIKEFKISGQEYFTNEEILRRLEPLVLNTRLDNFFGINNLLSWGNQPDVSKTSLLEAAISRDWLNQTVKIAVKERQRLAIWCDNNNHCYWIDNEGLAFEEAPETEGSLILVIFDSREQPIIKGNKVTEDRFANNIIKILTGVLDLKMPVKKAIFDGRLQEITIFSYSGPDLLFSIRFDPALNISSLKSLEEKIDPQKLKYVDLRVENRLYYKNL